MQLESLTTEQTTMKKRMDEISAGNAPKTTREDTSRCSGPVKQAPKAHHLPDKFVTSAINGEYVDFSEVLSSLSVLRPSHNDEGMLRTLSGDLIPIARLHASVSLTRLMSGCKCGPSTRWKLFLRSPSVTWNWQPTGNRSSLPTESFAGPPCTCLTYKRASTRPHARMLKLALTSWIQPCIPPSSTLPPFASIRSNVPVASPSTI